MNMHMNVGMSATSTLGAVHPILLKQSSLAGNSLNRRGQLHSKPRVLCHFLPPQGWDYKCTLPGLTSVYMDSGDGTWAFMFALCPGLTFVAVTKKKKIP